MRHANKNNYYLLKTASLKKQPPGRRAFTNLKSVANETLRPSFHYTCLAEMFLRRQTPQPPGRGPCRSKTFSLALSLLVLRVLTDNHDFPFAFDYFALFADRFYGSSNFHFAILLTFLLCLSSPCNSASGQIIGGKLHLYLIARQNPDKVHSYFT